LSSYSCLARYLNATFGPLEYTPIADIQGQQFAIIAMALFAEEGEWYCSPWGLA
jgi:hypothetical protein